MYGGAKGRRPPGLRERRHSGLRPGIAGADTLCQPLARLRAGARMPPFHTYFAGREASAPLAPLLIRADIKKLCRRESGTGSYRLFRDYRLLDDYFVGAAPYRHHVDAGCQGHFVAVRSDEG